MAKPFCYVILFGSSIAGMYFSYMFVGIFIYEFDLKITGCDALILIFLLLKLVSALLVGVAIIGVLTIDLLNLKKGLVYTKFTFSYMSCLICL